MIKSKKILGTFMLMLPLMMIGCNTDDQMSEESNLESSDKNNSKKDSLFSSITGKSTFNGLTVKALSHWQRVETQEDMLLYKIGGEARNVSLRVDDMKEGDLDSYIEKVKLVLGEAIDMSGAIQGDIKLDSKDLKTLEYDYEIHGKKYKIYQACFERSGKVYIFTLGSDEENMEMDKKEIEKFIINTY